MTFLSLKMIGSLTFLFLTGQVRLALSSYTATQIFEFPSEPYTAIENVIVRPNGQLILSTVTQPKIYLLNPSENNPSAKLIYTFPDAVGCLGLAETSPDIYAVVVGNYTISTLEGIPGSFSIWSVNLNPTTPVVRKITSIPQASALNGMTVIPENPNVVLVADSKLGAVWGVNVQTGAYQITIQNPDFTTVGKSPIGINGVHASGTTLYFTSSAQGVYGSIPITSTGTAAGSASIIAHAVPQNFLDDFALDQSGNAWITNHPTSVTKVTLSGQQTTIVNSTSIVQPAAAAFASGGCILYVITSGASSNTTVKSGQVFEIQTC